MLLAFYSKAAAEVLMLSQHAAPILRAAGKATDAKVPERGVFTATQIPAAIAAIERAVMQEVVPPEPDESEPAMTQHVSLRVRAYPLLDMLRRAHKKGVDVMWEPS